MLVHLNSLELGGTQINAVDLAVQVRENGIESVLVGARDTLPEGPSLLDIARDRGIGIELYDPEASILARGRQLTGLARRHRADLVHVYGSWGGGARPTYWGFSRFGRRPWVQTVYEMEVSPKIKLQMPLIVGTGYLVDDMRTRPGRTILISPPVDTDADRPDAAAAAAFRSEHDIDGTLLVIVSRLDASMKAMPIGVAIESMRDLASDATLAIVGAGDDASRLRAIGAQVNESVGREAVRFIGPMANPRPAYAAADIMLGMGGSAARSLSFAKPLVVQGEAGWSQLFEESTAPSLARNSYWSPDPDPSPRARLTGILQPLIADQAWRSELGAFGRRFAIERFGLTAMAAKLAGFYRESATSYDLRKWSADLPPEVAILARKVGRRAGLRLPSDDEVEP
ncbi:hypothetical protein ACFC1I_05520 [Microbacterium sp. NPDC056044]|uniref:hypothetical protein n=1 Tax=Microbacterium sp. NPDC056044 TaxID=3345690 RepID=UPI0035DE58C0